MVFLLLVSLLFNVVMTIGILRAMKRTETYDDFFGEMQKALSHTIDAMTKIDIRGSFQSDDEVGDTFKQLKGMVDALDVFLTEQDINDASN